MQVDHIFRSYDVRGIYGRDLDEEIMRRIGNAFGQMTKTDIVVVARDMRLSSKQLKEAFVSGLLSSGKNVVDAGLLPLGVGMFHAWQNKMEFAYITASHLPKEWNGVKFFHANGLGYMEQENFQVREFFDRGEKAKEKGHLSEASSQKIIDEYINYVAYKIKLSKKLHVVVDCGNGMAGIVAPQLFRKAGAHVEVVYGEVDGSFPNRNPEPAEDGLEELCSRAKKADLGIAYDGDGDRALFVDNKGRKVAPEQAAYLLLNWLLRNEPGPIVANVECTMAVDKTAAALNKKIIRIPVGHTYLMESAYKNNACLGIEFTGHFLIPSMFAFDDSLAGSLCAASALTEAGKPMSEIADEVEMLPFKRINFECSDKTKFTIIENLKERFSKQYQNVSAVDGVRIGFPHGWALIRASNTGPAIRLTIEAESVGKLHEMENEFSRILADEIRGR